MVPRLRRTLSETPDTGKLESILRGAAARYRSQFKIQLPSSDQICYGITPVVPRCMNIRVRAQVEHRQSIGAAVPAEMESFA